MVLSELLEIHRVDEMLLEIHRLDEVISFRIHTNLTVGGFKLIRWLPKHIYIVRECASAQNVS
jgi:hypothetical protein